jgi:hypothetical protein
MNGWAEILMKTGRSGPTRDVRGRHAPSPAKQGGLVLWFGRIKAMRSSWQKPACAHSAHGRESFRPEIVPDRWRGVVCRRDGLSGFDALRYRCSGQDATLVAFDLIELQADRPRFNAALPAAIGASMPLRDDALPEAASVLKRRRHHHDSDVVVRDRVAAASQQLSPIAAFDPLAAHSANDRPAIQSE